MVYSFCIGESILSGQRYTAEFKDEAVNLITERVILDSIVDNKSL